MRGRQRRWFLAVFSALAATPALAQTRHWAPYVVAPQLRVYYVPTGPRPISPPAMPIEMTRIVATVDVVDQAATTTLDIHLRNPSLRQAEAELVVPVPEGAVVRGFSFAGSSLEPTAKLLPRDEARAIYESLVSRVRDPALVEFVGYNLVRSSVFPVPASGTQQLRLTYEQLLPTDGGRIDYFLPRSEAQGAGAPWEIQATVRASRPIATAYSPSHPIETTRVDDHKLQVRVASSAGVQPGPFRLSWLVERGEGAVGSLFAYPDPRVGGGYFLFLASAPSAPKEGTPPISREVTFVIDTSGSMHGEKIVQAREAVLQTLEALRDGERFNVLAYNNGVDAFSPTAVEKNAETARAARAFVQGLQPRGGTNIHDALVEALRPAPASGTLPIVLFLTDGLPTIGQTSEAAIRDAVLKGNPHSRRVFTFGVGVDVNAPLLEKIAYETRGVTAFVLPGESVEVKVASVFERLRGPIFADVALSTQHAGVHAPGRIKEVMPSRLPDLFQGDQLVVLGQYVGDQPVTFSLAGNYLGQPQTFSFPATFVDASTKNAFVPRLWASRKIGILVDAVRQMGADGRLASASLERDPRLRELVDEIVRLSLEFGVLTEYTAFFAREGTVLTEPEKVRTQALDILRRNAVEKRSGVAAIQQDLNNQNIKKQTVENRLNQYMVMEGSAPSFSGVAQVNDLAFFKKGNEWIDGRLAARSKPPTPDRTIEFASPEFLKLAERLAQENRQASIALRGDILLEVDGKTVLVKGPRESAP